MALLLPKQSTSTFPIKNNDVYSNWDTFCVSSLNASKEEINKKRVFRYKSMADRKAEEARLRHVTIGIASIAEFIEEHGWKIFVAVALGFALSVAAGTTMAFAATNPVTLGLASIAFVGSATVTSYYGYKIYKHKELVVKVKDVLSPIKGDYDQYQPGRRKDNRPRIELLFYQSIKMIIEQIYECEIMVNDLSLPINPICLCGAVLVPKSNKECYGDEYSYVICDICDKAIQNVKDVFHCPQKKIAKHPDGYDICIKCAREHNSKFKRYHAVIIQSLPAKYGCKDAEALESLFQSLNYHEVITIRPENANKSTITSALMRMALNKKNDVVVICYSGHGGKHNNRFKCCLETYETITDQELVNCVKMRHNASGDGSDDDGVLFGDTCDVVILLNACYSARFAVQQSDNNHEMGDEKMPEYLMDYDNLGRNMITIAACGTEENANFYDEVSPFYKFVIEEMKRNQNATPQTLHKYIQRKSTEKTRFGIELAAWQRVEKAFKNGKYALHVPLCPAVKTY